MTPEERYGWRAILELKLRTTHGDSFQDFFSRVMEASHGSDFIRVRPYGSLGDKGCDGYRLSTGHVYQCYGAINGANAVGTLTSKMAADFQKAAVSMADVMKAWAMTHNLIDGVPVHAITQLEDLKKANSKIAFSFFGHQAFEESIFSLNAEKIKDLLGAVASAKDAENVQPAELAHLIAHVVGQRESLDADMAPIKPVPVDKLTFNNLPGHWQDLISAGWKNAHLVSEYLSRHHDPLLAAKTSGVVKGKYADFRSQGLPPGAIMSHLYEFVAGHPAASVPRQVAAQAILAYLFESCEIFEDKPVAQS